MNSINIFTGNGSTTDWSINFAGGYLSRDHVFARLRNTDQTTTPVAFTWLTDSSIRITPAVASGAQLEIYRDTPKIVPLVDYSEGAVINERNLDTTAQQTLFAVSELRDDNDLLNDRVAIAEDALELAQQAQTAAAAAQTAADAAESAATAAQTASATAVSTANSAQATANAIAGTAAAAVSTANAAQSSAAAATSTANTALSTANSIAATANTALSTAQAAESTANGIAGTAANALSAANSAASDATTALSTADSAASTATAAQATANGLAASVSAASAAASAAQADADAAQVTATAAQATAGTAQTAANTAQTTADAATVTANRAVSTNWTLRNKIINGNFDFWQRGTSSTATGYLADRWNSQNVGTTKTNSRQAFTLGQTAVPGEPAYYNRTVVSSVAGASNSCMLTQPVEGVRTLAGKTATLTFWAKADSSKNIAVEFYQHFGTGGSPSAAVTGIGVTTCALTSSWQKFTVTVAVPSISGKTLGTNADDCFQPVFWFDAGSSFNARTNSLGQRSGTFDIAQVQLEEGSIATPFEGRPQQVELALCQRYYQVIGQGSGSSLYVSGWATAGGSIGCAVYWSPMRTTPTVTQPTWTVSNASAYGLYSPSFSPTGGQLYATAAAAGMLSCANNGTPARLDAEL